MMYGDGTRREAPMSHPTGEMGHGTTAPAGDNMSGLLDPHIDMLSEVDLLPMDLDLDALTEKDMQAYESLRAHHDLQNQLACDVHHNEYNQSMGDQSSGVGAGPLPTGFGVQPSGLGGGSLMEFTKRRNWSQRVLDELKDFLYILTSDGRFLYASPSSKALTGYEPSELLGKFIVELLHPDDKGMFVREFHESIATGNPLRFFYRLRKPNDSYAIFESHGHPHLASEASSFGPTSVASFCRGFFMMARPYPTKNAALLDSFLEHKIENQRLRKRVAELKAEEQEDLEAQQRHWEKKAEGRSNLNPSESIAVLNREHSGEGGSNSLESHGADNYNGMPPPARPSVSNTALTRQNLNEALAASKPDSINDKMARYEGATHIETIEMITGLRYRDGERSQGISTGERSPALIRGDAGIAILVDKDGRPTTGSRTYGGSSYGDGSTTDKKKKTKIADEYVCTDCGTLDSPEWRKGPSGPKSLCNACGLRWAKKEKRRQGSGNPNAGGEPASLRTGSIGGSGGSTLQRQHSSPKHGQQASPVHIQQTSPMGTGGITGPNPTGVPLLSSQASG